MEDTEGLVGFFFITLHYSPYFKKSLQVVNLSECHCHQNQSFKEGPEHHSAVRVVIDWNKKKERVNIREKQTPI